jgi:hypothetical protein
MITNKITWSLIGLAFIGLVIVSLVGIALLAVLADEFGEEMEISWASPSFMQPYDSFRQAVQDSTGNEFTGDATAVLFAASSVPVGIDLIAKTIIRYAPIKDSLKGFIRSINNVQRKYLMPLHTYLAIMALGLGILHLTLSACIANPFPEIGLILSGILVATGLLFKLKALPAKIRKALYKFHASLIVSGVLLVILLIGHMIMGLD